MKFTRIARFIKEEFPEVKAWVDKLFLPLNQHVESVQQTLDHGLTWADNVKGEERDVEFVVPTSGSAFPIVFKSTQGRARAVWIGEAWDITSGEIPVLKPRFAHKSSPNQVTITDMDTVVAGHKYRIRFVTSCA